MNNPISLANLTRAIYKLKEKFVQIADAVRSVNNTEPDENGNIAIQRVDFAGDLESSSSQTTFGEFAMRTAGGNASIDDGDAWLARIQGVSQHIGYVPESIQMTVTSVSTEDAITAEIDEDVFRAAMQTSGTLTLVYSTQWNENPELYGITVSGEPQAGDQIVVVYEAEERGTIINSNPRAFISTGWNLYNQTAGYAVTPKYSDGYGYKIVGAYTALKFATTIDGSQIDLQVTSGNFNVPDDGYVFVTGGDSATTAIYPTWSDWTDEPNGGTWEAYSETEIVLSGVMASYFPYGLIQIGASRDEINISLGQAISRIEQMEYSAENLETAMATGRDYIYDEDNIYIVRATPVTSSISLDGGYTASDHGVEYFDGDGSVLSTNLYGNNLKNKLERDVLTISQQTLTSAQKTQARANIDAASQADVTTLNNNLTSLEGRSVSVPLPATFAAGANYNTNLKTIIDADLPAGKKCLGIIGWESAGAQILISQLRYANNSYSFQCVNTSSSAYTDKTAHVYYLCIKA